MLLIQQWPETRPQRQPLVDKSTVCRNVLSGRVAVMNPFLRKGNGWKERLRYDKLHKNWISGNRSKCKGFHSNCPPCTEEVRGEVKQWAPTAICKTPWIKKKAASDLQYHTFAVHYIAIQSGKHQIGYGFILQHGNDSKHTANAVKAYLDRQWNTFSHGLASQSPRHQHYWSSIGSFWQKTE